MKQMVFTAVALMTLLFSSCSNDRNVGIIGGADGPTNVVVGESKSRPIQTEKDAVRMVKIDGALYYETGEDNESVGRCGTMDGQFEKGAERFEIPKKDGTSNFSDGSGYQIGMAENTIEIPIEDDWEIFKKIEMEASNYQFCYILEREQTAGGDDIEYLVLANDMNITFDEAADKLSGSDSAKKDIYVLPMDD